MNRSALEISLESARRLAVTKQHLAGRLPNRPSSREVLSVIRDVGYIQWDPVSIVAPSHLLSLWSRVGRFRPAGLERLLWSEKSVFEHWTPMASLVLTEDYPLYLSLMRRYPTSLSPSWGSHRTRAKRFLAGHAELRRRMLAELKVGPLRLGDFQDHLKTRTNAGDWAPRSDVEQMLFHLTMSGETMVVGRQGNQNLWGLSEAFLPAWVDRTPLSEEECERVAAQRAIRALGTATPSEITYYFVRGRYMNLRRALNRLLEESAIRPVAIEGLPDREERYIHEQDLPVLESVGSSRWHPRMSLLPPFDNLLGSPRRTQRLFGFDYVREQFLPKEKRRYGTYVLPILWGERLIGRVDPRLDRARGELVINSVHAEPGAPTERSVGDQIGATVATLADFVGARRVRYTRRVPRAWRQALR